MTSRKVWNNKSKRGMTASGYCSNAKQFCEGKAKMSCLFVQSPAKPATSLHLSGNIYQQPPFLPPSHHKQSSSNLQLTTPINRLSYHTHTNRASKEAIESAKRTKQITSTYRINNGLQPFQLSRQRQLGRKAREDERTPSDDGEQAARKR